MKQLIIILLLFTSIAQGQTTLANKLKILANETSTTAVKVNVQESNGLVNTIAKADLIEVLEYSTASAMPVTGVSGKIYVTIDSGRLYRWNGTVYNEISTGGVTSVSGINGVTITNPTTTPIIGLGDITPTTVTTNSTTLTPVTAPSYAEGKVFYDSSAKTLVAYDDISGTSTNLGQELNLRARNNTGVTITNGSVVYISGATGQNPTIALARANSLLTSVTIGIATHDIANNTIGKITTFGLVNDLNTSAFTDGQILYVSPTTAGTLTATVPSSPNYTAHACVVLHSHVTQGKIFVRPEQPISLNTSLTDNNNTSPSVSAVKSYIDAGLSVKENLTNKQNSLTVDGTGVKYPTVDAVNNGLALKRDVANYTFALDITANSVKLGRGAGSIGTNTTVGQSVMGMNTTGTELTSVGFSSLASNTLGSVSTSIGSQSLFSNTIGSGNTAIGANSLYSNISGGATVAIGFQSGRFISDKTIPATIIEASVLIGSNTSPLANGQTNQIVIGNGSNGLGSNTAVLGNSATTAARLWGRFLSGTSVDNGIDQIQVPNGTISAQPATLSNQVVVKSQLDLKANIASPTFTGVPSVPTAAAGTNTTQIASTAFVSSAVGVSASKWTRNGSLIYPINTTDIVIIGDNTQALGAALKVRALSGSTNHAHFFNNANTLITSINDSGISTSSISANSTVTASQFSMTSEQGIYDNLYGKQFRPLSTHWLSNGQIRYQSDYSSTYDVRTLVDRGYIDNNIPKQLKDFYADVNNVGIAETDLYSYTTTASRLNAAGEKIVAVYGGTMNDVTASSQLKVYFGGVLIGDTGVLTMNAIIDFKINVSIIRTGATTARAILNIATRGASTPSYTEYTALTGLTFTNTNILKVTGTASGATGGDNDITATYGNIIWQPAAL